MTSIEINTQSIPQSPYFETPGFSAPASSTYNPTLVGAAQPLSQLLNQLDASTGFQYTPSANATHNALLTPPSTSPQIKAVEVVNEAHDAALVPVADQSVEDLLQHHIAKATISGEDQAFFVGDLSATYRAVQRWRSSALGSRVEIFYAVKCNPSPPVLHLLSLMGTSFDCASVAEINLVLSLPSAPSPDRIIFANPCKPASFVRSAARKGVEMMTFDNADELHKISRFHPDAKLVLRILTDDSKSLCRLGLKYGAPLSTCPGLISLARALGLNIIGVSFHVGSGCKDPHQFKDAIWRAKTVFEMGKKENYDFKFLDVGGGFEGASFDEMSKVIKDGLDEWFPQDEGVRVVAEPGRFLVSDAYTLATSIIARRRALAAVDGDAAESGHVTDVIEAVDQPTHVQEEGEGADVMYYINDGVYGSFNCILFDHQIVHPYPLTLSHLSPGALGSPCIPRRPGPENPANVRLEVDLPIQMGYSQIEKASVWGPTCDSIDCVRDVVWVPKGLEVGDWLGWSEMGAYTLCAASTFNGFDQSPVHYTTGGNTPESASVRSLLDSFML